MPKTHPPCAAIIIREIAAMFTKKHIWLQKEDYVWIDEEFMNEA